MNEFNITLFEACEFLNKSKKTVSRYVRQGKLAPKKVKSQQGTLEYRFSRSDLEALRATLPRETRQDRPDRQDRTEETDQTGHAGQTRQDIDKPLEASYTQENAIITAKTGQSRQDTVDRGDKTDQTGHKTDIIDLLKETTELLKTQLTIKDGQINQLNAQLGQLIERDRETNILLKGLQDKVLLLGKPNIIELPNQRRKAILWAMLVTLIVVYVILTAIQLKGGHL